MIGVIGAQAVRGVQVRWRREGRSSAVPADLLCVSGGFNPSVNLASMTRAPLTWSADLAAFVPGTPIQAERSAGAARGVYGIGRGGARRRGGRRGGGAGLGAQPRGQLHAAR